MHSLNGRFPARRRLMAAVVSISALLTGCGGSSTNEPIGIGAAPRAVVLQPRVIDGSQRFATLAVGMHHACALELDGTPWCWGSNEYGQLGTAASLPRCDGGRVSCSPSPTRVTTDRRFVAIAASLRHTCALEATGEAWCWGFGAGGQLGNGLSTDSATPVRVAGDARYSSIALGGGGLIACALESAGSGGCWGPGGGRGGLGDGTNGGSNAPVVIATDARFVGLTVGDDHACARTASGIAYCWGSNAFGKLGTGAPGASSVPALVASGLTFSTLGAGLAHTCGLAQDGRAWCWGAPASLGATATTNAPAPVAVDGGRVYASLVAGANHTCALDTNGTAWCWGVNLNGQLGDGTSVDRASPVAVAMATALARVSAGGSTCALDTAGRAWCWGDNTFGQAGKAP
jgi:alpha-tubulin suppressor-like RCC1 family protein